MNKPAVSNKPDHSAVSFYNKNNVLITFLFLKAKGANGQYSEILNKLKNDFERRWLKKTEGTSGLEEYERIRTLGTGSFGRVVSSKHISFF